MSGSAKSGPKSRRRNKVLSIAAAGVAGIIGASIASAASQTWTGNATANGNWSNIANWSGGAAPGAASGNTNTDIATFSNAIVNNQGSTGTPVVIDLATQNIGSIDFTGSLGSTTALSNYFIGATTGSNSLFLTSGGTIQIDSSLSAPVAVTETVRAPLVLSGANSSYTFTNNSLSGANAGAGTLVISGAITGGTAGADILNLGGSNTNNNSVSGNISNGAATTLSLNTTGTGNWSVSGNNSYTGTTTISSGSVTMSGANTFSNAVNVTGGTLTLSGSNSGTFTTTVNSGTLNINNANALGANGSTGALVLNGGTIGNSTANTIALNTANAVTWNGSFAFNGPSGLTMTSCPITFGATAPVISVNNAALTIGTIAATTTGLTVAGATSGPVGALILTTQPGYTGGTVLTGGDLGIPSDTTLNGTGALTFNGGALQFDNYNTAMTFNNVANVALGAGGISVLPVNTITGTYTGNGVTYRGQGTLVVPSQAYSGPTNINGGVAAISSLAGLGANNTTGAAVNFNGGTLQYNGFIDDLTADRAVTLNAAGGTIDLNGQTATFAHPMTGAGGFSVISSIAGGSLTFSGTAAQGYLGNTSVSGATLNLDFTNLAGSTNMVAPAALTLGTANLNLLNTSGNPSTQTFSGTTITAGPSTLTAMTNTMVNLGGLTIAKGANIVLNGPVTVGAGGAVVPATGTITTTTAGLGQATAGVYGLLASGSGNNDYATVGLYDWASTDTTASAAGTSPYTIVGGSAISGFYLVPGNNAGNPAAGSNVDVATPQTNPSIGSVNNVRIGSSVTWASIRFNTSMAPYVTEKSGAFLTVGGVLVTPNMGVVNAGLDIVRPQGVTAQIVQNNTLGVLAIGLNNNGAFFASGANAADAVVKSGAGTLFISPVTGMHIAFNFQNASGGIQTSITPYYDSSAQFGGSNLAFFANGGVTVISDGRELGNPATAGTTAGAVGTVNLDGGTLMGASNTSGASAATLTLTTSGGANRFVWLNQNGGGLAAQTNVTMTVPGTIGSLATAGPLVIGIPSSSANGNTPGLVPGTGTIGGTVTANPAFISNGTVTLNGPGNFFYGGVNITGGATLNINSMWQLGGANYDGGLTFNGGALQYATTLPPNTAGTLGAYEDVTVNSAPTPVVQPVTLAGSGQIDVNGHAITFANPVGNGGAGTLTVISSVPGGSLTLNRGVNSGAGGVTVATAGLITTNLILAGASTYTGPTAIQAGTLTLNSPAATLANTAITVSNAANFVTMPGAGGNIAIGSGNASLTLNAGSTFSMADGSIGTVTVNGSGGSPVLTLGGATLSLDVGTVAGVTAKASELIANNGTLSVSGSADVISLTGIGTAPSTLTNIPLLAVPGGSLSTSEFTLAHNVISFGATQYNATLSTGSSNTVLLLNLSQVVASLDYYYKGSAGSSSWSTTSNFATTHTGTTPVAAAPASGNNVFLTADSATNFASETLDGNYTINSLSFTGTGTSAAGSAITLAAGSGTALTINAGNQFQNASSLIYNAGVGLVVQSGSEAGTITAPIVLGSSQTWEIDNSASFPLTVNGGVSGTGFTLTKAGTGTLILGGNNSYTGGTTISAGTLQLVASSPSALPAVGALTVQGTGTFDLNGNNITVDALKDGGASTGTVTSTTGTPTLTMNTGLPTTFSGTLAGSLGLTYTGSSTQTLSGSNSYTGMTVANSGTLIGASNNAFGSPTSATGGLLMSPSTGTATVQFTSSAPSIASLASSGAGTSVIVLGNATAATPTTLTINTTGTNNTFSGTINDQTGSSANASGNLVISGNGSLTLAGIGNFTGTTSPTGTSTLVIGSASALQGSTLNYAAGNVSFGTVTAASLGGLSGNINLDLDNTTPAAVALSIGATNLSSTYTGMLTGAGSINKFGSGTFTIGVNSSGGISYTGNTNVAQGTLVIGGVTNYSGGTIDVTATNGTSGITFADSAIVNSPAFLRISSNDPNPTTGNPGNSIMLVKNNANLTFTGFAIGGNTFSRVPNGCSFTIQDNAVMIVNGPFITDSTAGSTASNNAFNFNGGLLGVQNIVPGGNATNQIPTLHFNGATIEALASDGANASTFFLPSSSNIVNVDGGGAIINPNSFNITINAVLNHGTLASGSTTDGGLTVTGSAGGSLLIANANTYTGPTTVKGSTLIISSANQGVQPLPVGTNVSIGSIATTPAMLQLQASPGTSGTILSPQVNSLSFAGNTGAWIGTLDITNNAMVVHTGSIANVISQLHQGLNAGAWNGSGGILSSTAAQDTSHLTAVGAIINDTTANTTGVRSGTTLYSPTPAGAPTVDGDILIKYTYYGDANLNGIVDGSDYSLIDNGFLSHLTGWYNGDFNYDGVVNGSDYTLIDNAFNQQGAQIAAQIAAPSALIAGGSNGSSVPEPASLGLLGIGAMGLLGRRRRGGR